MNRRTLWLLAALLLFGLAAWLMSAGENSASVQVKTKHAFPRQLDVEGWQRVERRLTLPPPPASVTPPDESRLRKRDPVLSVLRSDAKINLVLEASAIRDSPLGQLLLRCFDRVTNAERGPRAEIGPDLMRQIDRVAISDDVTVVSGTFDDRVWGEFTKGGKETRYGEGKVYPMTMGTAQDAVVATYGRNLVLLGSSLPNVENAIDRLDGRIADSRPAIRPGDTYGEVYGVLDAREMRSMLPPEIAEKLADAARSIEIHADTRDDVLIVADVEGPEATRLMELGRTLAGALTLGRVKARADKDDALQQLLEQSRVSLHDTSFRIEAAFPLSVIAARLGECAAEDAGTTTR